MDFSSFIDEYGVDGAVFRADKMGWCLACL